MESKFQLTYKIMSFPIFQIIKIIYIKDNNFKLLISLKFVNYLKILNPIWILWILYNFCHS